MLALRRLEGGGGKSYEAKLRKYLSRPLFALEQIIRDAGLVIAREIELNCKADNSNFFRKGGVEDVRESMDAVVYVHRVYMDIKKMETKALRKMSDPKKVGRAARRMVRYLIENLKERMEDRWSPFHKLRSDSDFDSEEDVEVEVESESESEEDDEPRRKVVVADDDDREFLRRKMMRKMGMDPSDESMTYEDVAHRFKEEMDFLRRAKSY